MKSQLQLDELARQLMTQKKKDVIVDTSNVNFHANGDNTLHLAEIDHGLLVEPPTGKEIGWVPVATQVEQPDGIWQLEIDVRETPIGRLVR